MKKTIKKSDLRIKESPKFDEVSDLEMMNIIKRTRSQVCKPCWELKYCPYGPFVEEFPLLPLTLKEADELIAHIKMRIEDNKTTNPQKMTKSLYCSCLIIFSVVSTKKISRPNLYAPLRL